MDPLISTLLSAMLATHAGEVQMNFGPPISLKGGGKMSNTLDMGAAGFASGGFAFFGPPRSEGVVFSVDGVTYRKAFNMSVRG